MKKFLALILVALMVVPFAAMASTTVSAAETTLYVKAGGTGSGNSEADAMGDFKQAIETASQLPNDVKIVVCGEVEFDVSGSYYEGGDKTRKDMRANKITWTGKDASSKLMVKTASGNAYYMYGALTIENLPIVLTEPQLFQIITHFNDLTVGEGCPVTVPEGSTNYITIRANISTTQIGINETTGLYDKDANIVLKSGRYTDVCYFNGGTAVADSEGDFNVTISGTAQVANLSATRGGMHTVKNANYILDGGIIDRFIAAADRPAANFLADNAGVTGTLTFTITKNYDATKSFVGQTSNSTTWFGISGTTAGAVTDNSILDKAEYILKIDSEVYDVVMTVVQPMTFDKIFKGDQEMEQVTPDTEAPDTETQAPETSTAPTTDKETTAATDKQTTAATDKQTTKDTSKNTSAVTTQKADGTTAAPADEADGEFPIWIIIVITVVIVVAAVVIIIIAKKKKA